MKQKAKLRLIVASTFLVFVLLDVLFAGLLQLGGLSRWLLRGGLWLLGVLFAFLVYRLLTRAWGKEEPVKDEIAERMAEAGARLASSSLAETDKLGKLPLVLLLGPSGSTKTTVMARSGLDPDLLAGEVMRGDTVLPTETVNVWYGEKAVFVEASGKLLDDPERWARVIGHIQPDRLAAALAGGTQAPRVAVVCFGCDELLKPGAAESVAASARTMRARLQELSQRLGIHLPVYVLFTKMDRLPYFSDYVRNFSGEEALQPLGATLPLAAVAEKGSYGERESGRLTRAFQHLYHSLASKRLQQLPRESREEVRIAAYEFPREFRKVSGLAVEFLVELCRPSQLGISPFLRGFYFTGVRAVVVSDQAAAPAAASPLSASAPVGATMVFNAKAVQEAAHAAPPAAGSRKVPQWLFLGRLVRHVVLRDRVALGLTGGGARVNALRRGLIAAAAALFLVLAVGFTASFRANRALAGEVLEALRGVEPLADVPSGQPSLDALERLDRLRVQAERLGSYERIRRPWGLRWGLYTGSTLHPAVRSVYFDRFYRVLGSEARGNLLAYLGTLPSAPTGTSDYGTAYDALKGYLITTAHPDRSTDAFLAPVLMSHWMGGAEPDQQVQDLARAQFGFYSTELTNGNPYAESPDAALVTRTRQFLARFTDVERLYQSMVSDASAALANGAVQPFTGSTPALRNNYSVPAAFTRAGWDLIQENLANVDQLFSREDWVTGGQTVSDQDLARLARDLRARYVQDYVGHWQQYLAAASVAPFAGADDAARKLAMLSGNESPLLAMLYTAARNTTVDSLLVAPSFQPVHVVTPPDVQDRYIGESNKPYIDALGRLQSAMEMAADAPPAMRSQILSRALGDASQAQGAVRQLAQNFRIEGNAQEVGATVRRLLEAPINAAERLIGVLPYRQVNAKGSAFCREFGQITVKYPFDPAAGTEASLDEVSAMFKPGESALWAFYDDALRDLVSQQGSGYVARAGASPRPSREFVDFFNRAAAVSAALYRPDGSGPVIDFVLRFEASEYVPEVSVSIDGQNQTFTRTFVAGQRFRWEGVRAQNARVTGVLENGTAVVLVEAPPGPWALFRLLQQAEWRQTGNGRYLLQWPIQGRQITLNAELILAGGVPILNTDYLSELQCVPTIAAR